MQHFQESLSCPTTNPSSPSATRPNNARMHHRVERPTRQPNGRELRSQSACERDIT